MEANFKRTSDKHNRTTSKLACVSQKTRKLLGPVDFSGLFSGEFLGSRKAFLNAPENTPDSHPSFSGCFLRVCSASLIVIC